MSDDELIDPFCDKCDSGVESSRDLFPVLSRFDLDDGTVLEDTFWYCIPCYVAYSVDVAFLPLDYHIEQFWQPLVTE